MNAASACAAMRAELSAFEKLPYWDNARKPITGSPVPVLPLDLGHHERLVDLLAMAISDAQSGEEAARSEQVPLLVAVAKPGRPGGGAEFAGELVARVESRLERKFHPRLSRVLTGGNAAGFQALEVARKLMWERRVPSCLVCAVDSFLNARSLLWLEEYGRLKTQRNADGVIPGEAAACVRVALHTGAERALATIVGLGFAREPALVLNQEPLRAEGLVGAGRAALEEAGLRMQDVDLRLSDASGELYGFKEQALALTRLLRVRRETFPLWLCAGSIGEVGAAASICQLVRVVQAYQRGYAPGERAMCFASSVLGERAVAVVQRPKQRGEGCR
ncbi:3-oxoacyl-ACP synthase [Cystobacter ferrugineus]|uniref:3-oxoacyl-ACP synthase n=1 Tax=Cystobacter ferrugineus TaxID=83449 RepID=UPI001160E57B|nr:3-oxoacyl-ACP synthase [Cystobacter ferrugineus]